MPSTTLASRFQLFGQFFTSVKNRGLARTLEISWFELAYERRFSAETAFIIPASTLDADADARSHAQDYFPSSYLVMHEALAGGSLDCRGQVFVDYGCGMGRALLFASTLPFARIIGVEMSAGLSAAAKANLERYYSKAGKSDPPWSVVTSDARRFEVPDDATVFYFFNPFDAEVLSEVIDRIVASMHRAPRRCTAVYANPVHGAVFREHGFSQQQPMAADFSIFVRDAQ